MRAKRQDSNQKQIVSHLKKLGAEVLVFSSLGYVLDLVVKFPNGFRCWIEVKEGNNTLTPREIIFCNVAPGPIFIVRELEDIDNLWKVINAQ